MDPVLSSFDRLKCLLFLLHDADEIAPPPSLAEDPRFVVNTFYTLGDWVSGAYGEPDHWAMADVFIAARRAGTIDRNVYCMAPP
ncbi:hypothetical protein B0H19DRAFT_1378722 [Mycena capillaripes]|nr:hypothetical protein B0H19DRAFT_1378722 [Mycena capillaripes]